MPHASCDICLRLPARLLAHPPAHVSVCLSRIQSADCLPAVWQIDHGYTLPSTFADVSFEWLYWPQAQVPFDTATRAYIAGLSSEADLATLAAHHLQLSLESARVFKASTMLLQKVGRAPRAVCIAWCTLISM